MKAEAEGLRARRAGVRLMAFGFVLEVVGLLLLAFVDQRSGGAVTHANVARAVFILGSVGVFFAASFWLVMRLRG
jgi:hypothetical protein